MPSMQPIEIALFGAVTALAAGLIGYLLWPFTRARRVATSRRVPASQPLAASEAPPATVVCPACQREYDAGLQFCPHDARELVPAGDVSARSAAPGMTCPSCRRSFDAMKKFCPFDGDELVPLTLALGTPAGPPALGAAGAGGVASVAGAPSIASAATIASIAVVMGKICPHCSRRYESDATFCGRDGSALVSVN
jgi:hypothetical protein